MNIADKFNSTPSEEFIVGHLSALAHLGIKAKSITVQRWIFTNIENALGRAVVKSKKGHIKLW